MNKIGRWLSDRFEIKQPLSQKTGRETWLAVDQQTADWVVVKLLTFSSDFEWEALKLFEREIQILQHVTHPQIPRYIDSFELDQSDCRGFALVQSYIDAPSLETHLRAGRTFSELDVEQIAEALLRILIELHTQNPPIVHRDIKPSNILLGDRSGSQVGQVYLVDFGSVQLATAHPSGTITIVGTYGYMPPEQFAGRAVPASDLYSLGATLIYLATGQHPADLLTDELRIEFKQCTGLSPGLIRWLERLVAPLPSQRFAHATVALEALRQSQSNIWHLSQSIEPPIGSQIRLESRDPLCFRLPHAYLPGLGAVGIFDQVLALIGLAGSILLLVFIFTVSAWHILLLILLIYLCGIAAKIRFYKLMIDRDQLQIQSFLLNHRLKTWRYPKQQIQRLEWGRKPLSKWQEVSLMPEQHPYQVVITIGATPHVILSTKRSEIEWLAQQLSQALPLPLIANEQDLAQATVLANRDATDATHFSSTDALLSTDRFKSPIAKPFNSQIQLKQSSTLQTLEFSFPSRSNHPGILLSCLVLGVLTFGLVPVLLILLQLLSGSLYRLLNYTEGTQIEKLRIDADQITLQFRASRLIRFQQSYPRRQITRLEFVPDTYIRDPGAGMVHRTSWIVIWIGTLSFTIDHLKSAEGVWVTQELSAWLDLPVIERSAK